MEGPTDARVAGEPDQVVGVGHHHIGEGSAGWPCRDQAQHLGRGVDIEIEAE
jgi:hypothetical protein